MIQNFLNFIYRHPKSRLIEIRRICGWLEVKKMESGKREMYLKSKSLLIKNVNPVTDGKILNVNFLTGDRFLYQTLFCAYSLQKVSKERIHFTIFDDGSLQESHLDEIKKQIYLHTVVTKEAIDLRLSQCLPSNRYPFLNKKRTVYPHIKKLIDVHCGNTGWQLVLDSDMLFFREPKALLSWLKDPKMPFYILDTQDAYGYPIDAINELCGCKIPSKTNVGIIGLKSEDIDFDLLEKWASTLEKEYGASYYLEQALSAMLIGKQLCTIGSKEDYIVFPTNEQISNTTGILHHYVDLSKNYYFQKAWKKVI